MSRVVEVVLTCGKRKWIWSGCVLILLAVALYTAGARTESGDVWVGLQNGRHATAGDWATRDPHRTWQMKALDGVGIHLTFQDPFSARSRPYQADSLARCGWINQNWLSHVLLYRMEMAFGNGPVEIERGETLIVIYKFLQVIIIALLMYGTARILGAHPLLSVGAVACGLLICYPFFDLRPNTTSFLFAALMMLLLALWRTSSGAGIVLYGMVPLILVWANMHGGFFYALLVFPLVCILEGVGDCLHNRWPRHFAHLERKKFVNLVACTALVLIVPAILSPFGIRNVFHPLLISIGQDARTFQEIAEWRPIWELRSSQAQAYVAFASILGAALIVWFAAWTAFRPATTTCECRSETLRDGMEWPMFDPVQAGIALLTLWMATKSRRFIPLAVVVGSPYLAQVLHQIVGMVGWSRLKMEERLSAQGIRALALLGAGLTMTAGIWGLERSYQYTRNLFDSRRGDGERVSVFRWMSTSARHPLGAAEFLNANRITGIVFNEWVDGGFIAFQQTPDPNTGQPPCRVFIDGRSQAAYDVKHYIFWKLLNSIPSPNYREEYGQVEAEAQQRSRQTTDAVFLQSLIADYLEEPCDGVAKDGERERRERYGRLSRIALSHPIAFDALLRQEGVNVILISATRRADYRLFDSLPNWIMVYQDGKHVVFLRQDCPQNSELLRKDPAALQYPDDVSRKLSVGLRYCASDDPVRCAQGVELLMSMDRPVPRRYTSRREFVPGLGDYIFEYGIKLDMHDEIVRYLNGLAFIREQPDKTARDRVYAQARVDTYEKLAELAMMRWKYDEARRYFELAKVCREQYWENLKTNPRRL